MGEKFAVGENMTFTRGNSQTHAKIHRIIDVVDGNLAATKHSKNEWKCEG